MRNWHENVLLLLTLILVPSCGDDGTPRVPSEPNSPSASAGIGRSGGVVELESSAGTLSLAFPPDAVIEPITVTLTEVEPTDDSLVRFEVDPSTVRLLVPATLRLELTPDTDPSGWTAFFGSGSDRVPVPTTWDGTALEATLRSIDARIGDARRVAPAPLDFSQVMCTEEIANLREDIVSIRSWVGTDGSPSILSGRLAGLLRRYDTLRGSACEFDEEATVRDILAAACDAYDNARIDALALPAPETFEQFELQIARVLNSVALIQKVGGTCSGNWSDVIESEIVDFQDRILAGLDWDPFGARLGPHETVAISAQSPWRTAWSGLFRLLFTLRADLQALGFEETIPWGELFATAYDAFRDEAFDTCSEFNTQAYLAEVATGGGYWGPSVTGGDGFPSWASFTSEDALSDLHHCGSRLKVTAYDTLGDVEAEVTIPVGDAPGSFVTDVVLDRVPDNGVIAIEGPVRALYCEPRDGTAHFSDDEIVVRVDGTELGREAATIEGEFFASPLELDIQSVFDASTSGTNARIELVRSGAHCGGDYRRARSRVETPLYSIEVSRSETGWPGMWRLSQQIYDSTVGSSEHEVVICIPRNYCQYQWVRCPVTRCTPTVIEQDRCEFQLGGYTWVEEATMVRDGDTFTLTSEGTYADAKWRITGTAVRIGPPECSGPAHRPEQR